MSKAKEDKEVVVPTTPPPPSADFFGPDDNTGFEDVGRQDILSPFVGILQAMSPQVKKRETSYVPGAEEGMIFNRATQELWEEMFVVPVHYSHRFTLWRPRKAGGGLVEDFGSDSSCLDKATRQEEGGLKIGENDLVESLQYVCYQLKPDKQVDVIILNFSGTQIKKSRNWMTRLMNMRHESMPGKRLPLNARVWRLSTITESNEKGSWFGWQIDPDQWLWEYDPSGELARKAVQLRSDINEQRVSIAADAEANAHAQPSADSDVI